MVTYESPLTFLRRIREFKYTIFRLLSALNTDPFQTGEGKQVKIEHLEAIKRTNEPIRENKKRKYLQRLMEDIPIRIFSIAWLLFCFFFVTYLSAEIQSKATVSRLERRIESLEDVADVSWKQISSCSNFQ